MCRTTTNHSNKQGLATILTVALLCITFGFQAHAATWYVDKSNAGGSEDGTSWATAFVMLQPAVDAAGADGGGEVWIAAGVYDEVRTKEVVDGEQTGSLILLPNISLMGGFTGSETLSNQRDPKLNVTTISGLASLDGLPANSVILGALNASLDGLTITGGVAIKPDPNSLEQFMRGGGLTTFLSEPMTVSNCIFSSNSSPYGGAILSQARLIISDTDFIENSSYSGGGIRCTAGDLVVNTSVFRENWSHAEGGAIYIAGAYKLQRLELNSCTFESNTSRSEGGGAVFTRANTTIGECIFRGNSGGSGGAVSKRDGHSDISIYLSLFEDNSAGGGGAVYLDGRFVIASTKFHRNVADSGGAIYSKDNKTPSSVTNSVFLDNYGERQGGAIFAYKMEVEYCSFGLNSGGDSASVFQGGGSIENSIFWNQDSSELRAQWPLAVSNSIIRGGFIGANNLNQDPLFLDPANGDLRLTAGSPAIDSGDPTNAPASDVIGIARPEGAGFDMGAFEFPTLDSDGDTLPDAYEGNLDVDNDSLGNADDIDSDNDGILDEVEGMADVDGDGKGNFVDTDSDGNMIGDADEGSGDLDGDGILDFVDFDNDGDTIADVIDGSGDKDSDGIRNMNDLDSDDDGLSDESEGATDTDEDGIPNFLDTDSDDDGLTDENETSLGTNPYDSDTDDDGLNDSQEIANGWNPNNDDTDGDGLPDGYEFENGHDPGTNDAGGDSDDDGLTNAEEFDLGTDPQDDNDPPSDVYVSTLGTNNGDAGSEGSPFRTVPYALSNVQAFSTINHIVTIYVEAGTYSGLVSMVPNVSIIGDDPDTTILQHFNASDDQHFVVVGANNSKLENVTVKLPDQNADVSVLVEMNNVAMELSNVIVDGGFNPFSIGVFASGTNSSFSTIRGSTIKNLNDGVWASNSGVILQGNTFQNILRYAVFTLPADTRAAGDDLTPLLGDGASIEDAGLNRFRNVNGLNVLNFSNAPISATYNDWGTDQSDAIADKLSGDIAFEPFISSEILDGSVVIQLVDADTGQQVLTNGQATISVGGAPQATSTDVSSGLYILNGVNPGAVSLTASGAGFSDTSEVVTISETSVNAVTIPMTRSGAGGGSGGGGGCFIATAAYGTPMTHDINVLRKIRDRYLLQTTLGMIFSDLYYRVSPPIADAMATRPILRNVARVALVPIVTVSSVILAHPALITIALMLLMSAIILLRIQRRFREDHSEA